MKMYKLDTALGQVITRDSTGDDQRPVAVRVKVFSGDVEIEMSRGEASRFATHLHAVAGEQVSDPRQVQLVTTGRTEDYMPATAREAVDQAHGMLLSGMRKQMGYQPDSNEGNARMSIRAAEELAAEAAAYVAVVKRAFGASFDIAP